MWSSRDVWNEDIMNLYWPWTTIYKNIHTYKHNSHLNLNWHVQPFVKHWTKPQSYHFSLWTPKVKVKVSYSIVRRHFKLLVGVSVQDGTPRWICWLPRHSEAFLIVQRQANILSVQGATWEGGWDRREGKSGWGVAARLSCSGLPSLAPCTFKDWF